MSNQKRPYDSTVARIAGNLLSGMMVYKRQHGYAGPLDESTIEDAVATARAIVAETKRTEPAPPTETT